ncbi:MAG: tetratricopeptide (TPR) repeat protein [Bradymonadia bacterium]|jgi:tetratricopeptide (TPR) repeat protein
MLNLLISLGAGFAVGALFALLFSGWGYGVIPGLIVAVIVFVVLGRRVLKDVQERMARVQRILTPKNPNKATKPRIDDAVAVLQEGIDKWAPWQFFVEGQVCGQIGMLYYLDKRFDLAQEPLEKSSPRNWISKAMLGAIYYRRKRPEDMKAAFEDAVKYSPKESLLWNAYAWCLYKRQDRDGAISVLNRAVEKLGNEERTGRNLTAVQNSKGMKMKGWNEMWYQFHLEKPPQMQQQQFGKR